MRVAVRNWLIRGLILTGVAALVALGWVANSWVSPERVREQVIASLNEQFEGVEVHVGSARMRILGGIAVKDLKLIRRGAAPDQPFFHAPAAVLYHDKEQLNRGRLVIRKVELENPEVHLDRTPDGQWNLGEVLRPGPADRPVPTFSAKGATLTLTDHGPDALPALRLTDARFTLMNDPLPVLTLTAEASAQGYGPVQVRARLNRITRQASVWLELPEFPLGEAAAVATERFAPALGGHPGKLTATAAVKAELTYSPESSPTWRYDVRLEMSGGRLDHPDLPWPVEKIAAKLRYVDGRVRVEEATARVGPAQVRVSLETRADRGPEPGGAGQKTALGPPPAAPGRAAPPDPDAFARVEDRVQRLDVTVSGVPLDDALFARLGEAGAKAKRVLSPTGTAEVVYKFAREATGWKREFEVRPQAAGVTYEKFRYPVAEVQGSVRRTVTHAGGANTLIDLRGKVAGQSVTLKGQLYGDGPDPAVNLRVAGTNVPLDDALIAAFPGKYPELIRQFRATGRADFVAEIVRRPGADHFENEFRVEIRDATVKYTQFPYLFEKVKGRVIVRVTAPATQSGEPAPDRDEIILDGFTGAHGGATVWLHGSKRPVPGSRDRKLVLQIGGNGCPVDADLKSALAALKLDDIWSSFSPRGSLTFAADVEILDRAAPPARPDDEPPFNKAADLKLTFNFYGPTVTPAFFPYELTDLSGWLEYKSGRVDLAHLAGRHGESRLKLTAGEVRFYPDGVVWANLGGLEIKPLVADPALLGAFPAKLRAAAGEVKLKGGADLTVKHLVVLTPPPASLPPPEPLPIAPAAGNSFPGTSLEQGGGQTPGASSPPSFFGTGIGGPDPSVTARGQAPVAAAPPRPFPVAVPPQTLPTASRPDPVVYWDAELNLGGASLEIGVPWESVFGRVGCRGRYEGTHLGLVLGNVYLDQATVARQPVTVVKAHVRAAPQQPDPARPGQFLPPVLLFTDVSGALFHGVVGGAARVVLADPVGYGLWVTATDVQLEEVARHYKVGSDADLKGVAQAQLWLYNRQDPRTGQWSVEGSGKVDVPAGRMYNLPVLLDLVKVLKLQTPDKTAFEEAHATFRIQGDRVKVDQLDLIGKAVCVGGTGEVDSSGEYIRFEFYMLGSEILARLVNTPVGDLSAFLSRNLFVKIKLTRENGVLKYKPEPVPAVTEPVKAITDRLRSRAAKMMGK
ncbi:MAG: hypothetical protein JWO38_3462 [Gemmataceae bacterium]|nr:hypothetical protein [Gemmataceae bacterium]